MITVSLLLPQSIIRPSRLARNSLGVRNGAEEKLFPV
jgi:hypothetical protein